MLQHGSANSVGVQGLSPCQGTAKCSNLEPLRVCIMQAQESKEGEQDEQPDKIDDVGQPIMELYVTRRPDGSLSQQASVLRPVPPPVPEADASNISIVAPAEGMEAMEAMRSISGQMGMSGVHPVSHVMCVDAMPAASVCICLCSSYTAQLAEATQPDRATKFFWE